MRTNRLVALARWFLPGLGVKRWLILVLVGIVLFVNGFERFLISEGVRFHVNEFIDGIVVDYLPPAYLAYIFAAIGIALIFVGLYLWTRSIARASNIAGRNGTVDTLLGLRLRQGYKIVAIGGG